MIPNACSRRRIALILSVFSIPLSAAAATTAADTIFDAGFELGETAQMTGPCNGFYSTSFVLAEGMNNPPTPSMAKPDKGELVQEPSFGTCLVRTTIHDVEPPVTFARNDYSRREAFNADMSRYLVYAMDGAWHVYDANTLQWVVNLHGPGGDAEPQWSPTDPNILYYVPINGGTQLRRMHVDTNTWEVAADFNGALPSWANGAQHIWTRSEGSPSADQHYWGFQVEDGDFNTLGYIIWDLQQNQLAGSKQNSQRPDHVSMTPSGRYFVASGGPPMGTWAWNHDFTQKKKLHHTSEHSDLAVGPNGHDYYVSVDYESNQGDVFFIDIDNCPFVAADDDSAQDCPRTVLFELYQNGSYAAMHISGKAFSKPGWALMGTYGTGAERDGTWPWYTNKLFAIELTTAGTPRVYDLAYHRVDSDGYWTEPQGSVSRDFSRIVFNTNWSTDSETDVDDYLVQLPPGAIPDARQ